jgi:DnaJ-class molecular chaperone
MSQFVETCTACDGSGKACNHNFHTLAKSVGQMVRCPSCGRTEDSVCEACEGRGEVWIDNPTQLE